MVMRFFNDVDGLQVNVFTTSLNFRIAIYVLGKSLDPSKKKKSLEAKEHRLGPKRDTPDRMDKKMTRIRQTH